MSVSFVSPEWRRIVAERADWLCEYCLIAEQDTFFGCQIDHVISEKHGGPNELDNLAFACTICNRKKGSDIGSIFWESGEYVRLFHPRQDVWRDHFQLVGPRIEGLTPIGKVTSRLLGFNSAERIAERELLGLCGRFPCEMARNRL